jgi:hypothetical protein
MRFTKLVTVITFLLLNLLAVPAQAWSLEVTKPLTPKLAPYDFDRPWNNIRIMCTSYTGLVKRLKKVINEQQVYNNEKTIWNSKNGCYIHGGRKTTMDRKIAAQHGVWKPKHLGGFVGWVVTKDFLFAIEHFAFIDLKRGTKAWRPARVYSRKSWELPPSCFNRKVPEFPELVGHQFSGGSPIDELGRQFCAELNLKKS